VALNLLKEKVFKMKTFKLIGMVLIAVLACTNFTSCNNEDEVVDKEDLSTYFKTDLRVNGQQYLVRLNQDFNTPDMGASYKPSYGYTDFWVNGVREDGLAVQLDAFDIPTPLIPNANIGKYVKLWCCLWGDVGTDYVYDSGYVKINKQGNDFVVQFSNAVFNITTSYSEELSANHSKQTLNGQILIPEDKISGDKDEW